ncbi:hypothetical protein BDW22DRAFT_374214 [Trametopsis cervina]|nr:hypothetical protein BDW22DRAFT_374214 [Trametopsis cervina]
MCACGSGSGATWNGSPLLCCIGYTMSGKILKLSRAVYIDGQMKCVEQYMLFYATVYAAASYVGACITVCLGRIGWLVLSPKRTILNLVCAQQRGGGCTRIEAFPGTPR